MTTYVHFYEFVIIRQVTKSVLSVKILILLILIMILRKNIFIHYEITRSAERRYKIITHSYIIYYITLPIIYYITIPFRWWVEWEPEGVLHIGIILFYNLSYMSFVGSLWFVIRYYHRHSGAQDQLISSPASFNVYYFQGSIHVQEK